MPVIKESQQISGVFIIKLDAHEDERGRLLEIFRKAWFPQMDWRSLQSNRSESAAGVLRGLHYHHDQADYWYVVRGIIRAGLVDLRRSSPNHGVAQIIELDSVDNSGLFIPVGVAHGFLAVTEAMLIYYVDNYYDGSDEYGVAWDDPDIGLDWNIDNPIISVRDMKNPRLRDIPTANLPA